MSFRNLNCAIQSFCVFALLLSGCANENSNIMRQNNIILMKSPSSCTLQPWSILIENTAIIYGIDKRLISAIISVESGGNPNAISQSNAVGLMQIKASTAGLEVYRMQGRRGEPTTAELQDPAKNIDIGTCYIHLLQTKYLSGIRNPEILRYATIVAYGDGIGALLRTFSNNRYRAISMINSMSPAEFLQHIQIKHPSMQAPRYLWKVNNAYYAL